MGRDTSLASVKAYFIPLKIEPYQVESLQNDLEKAGEYRILPNYNIHVTVI